MTCLTWAFQQPAYSGTTIDERLVLHPGGGAIATWGPTGLGIAHGHDALQRGFYRALWSRPPATATLGDLTLAGYRELFLRGSCCQDTLRTFGCGCRAWGGKHSSGPVDPGCLRLVYH
jgi:hypothetical protein